MNLNPTAEQTELRSMLRKLFAGTGPGLWATTAELGLLGLSLPESLGGAGAGMAEEQILFEEAGRALAPVGLFSAVALALPLLTAAPDAAAELLSGRRYGLAWAEAGRPYGLDPASVGNGLTVESGRISGRKRLVPDFGELDTVVVLGPVGAYLVDAADTGRRDREAFDESRPLGDLTLSEVDARALPVDAATVEQMFSRAIVLAAAEAVGVAEAVLALACDHVTTRTQFGRPIGSFQAVSHPLADLYAEIELARSLGILAAGRVEDGSTDSPDVHALAVASGSLAVRACEVVIQVHGGIGMTWESSLHRYYKRARQVRTLMGSPDVHRSAIVRGLLPSAG
jgi:alkylation response protein AidB-like acyl-CoA dehydrogenase